MRQVVINISQQRLDVFDDEAIIFSASISTALNGAGEKFGSECTPRGKHIVRAKIGGGCKENSVFVARRPTGELLSSELQLANPQRDWILTRILWLSGCEKGRNRLGNVDTMRRYIYIHGCPDGTAMGNPASHGCIRMTNQDVIAVFELLPVGTAVLIQEQA